MSTLPEELPPAVDPLDPALFEEHFAKAKRRLNEVKALLHVHFGGKADQAVLYTQSRHREIDRLLQVILAEATLLSRIGGDRRRALEARVVELESTLATMAQRMDALEAAQSRSMEGERDNEPRRASPARLSAVT